MEEKPAQQHQTPPPPPPHHFYYYNHHHHQQQFLLAEGGGPGKAPPQKPPAAKHESKFGAAAEGPSPPQPEALRKKAGYGELNGSVAEREPLLKGPGAGDPPGFISRVPNGSQPSTEPGLPLKPAAKGSVFGKAGLKAKSFSLKGGLDRRGERGSEGRAREGTSWEKAEAPSVPNGVVPGSSSGPITNGFVGKGADNDGSGSESGYTTPKKRKGRRNSVKGCENLNPGQEEIRPCELAAVAPTPEPEALKTDGGDPKGGGRRDGLKPPWKCEAGSVGLGRRKPTVGDLLRKSPEAKVGAAGKKFEERPKGKPPLAAPSKEDSWTLFKPPPVFPVDNSSAKIVPKISYASKVKENLNRAAQNSAPSLSSSSSSSSLCSASVAAEAPVPPSTRLSQVPMSAMKSVTSAGFANGPVLAGADRGACPAGAQALLGPGAGPVLLASSKPVSQDMSPPAGAADQQKSSLFICPSNPHGLFNAAAQADPPLPATQQSLGDIFQNQWGLSFINEPSVGPETAPGKPAEATFQGPGPSLLELEGASTPPAGPDPPAFPKAYELDKRTSPQLLSGLLKLGAAGEEGDFLFQSPLPGGLQQAELSGPGAFVFLSKDYNVDRGLSVPTNSLLGSTKDPRGPRGLERKQSWGEFDLRAAVLYHSQEMESICNLQKQDPKRIITYAEAMEHPST